MPKRSIKKPNSILEQKLGKPGSIDPGSNDPGKERRTDEEIIKDIQGKIASTQPNLLFLPLIKMPFTAWARSVNEPKLLLADLEAIEICRCITMLSDYYMPKMPPIIYAWISTVGTLGGVVYSRMLIVKAINDAKKKEQPPLPQEEKCPKCDFKATDKKVLEDHIKEKHPG